MVINSLSIRPLLTKKPRTMKNTTKASTKTKKTTPKRNPYTLRTTPLEALNPSPNNTDTAKAIRREEEAVEEADTKGMGTNTNKTTGTIKWMRMGNTLTTNSTMTTKGTTLISTLDGSGTTRTKHGLRQRSPRGLTMQLQVRLSNKS